jgi:hypothetical protein
VGGSTSPPHRAARPARRCAGLRSVRNWRWVVGRAWVSVTELKGLRTED